MESEKIDGNRVKYHRDTEAVLLEKRQKKISKLGDLDDKFESQAVFEKIEKIDKYLKKFFDKKISPPPEPSVPERPNFLRVQPRLHIDFIGDIDQIAFNPAVSTKEDWAKYPSGRPYALF